jgi:hypothetical protein
MTAVAPAPQAWHNLAKAGRLGKNRNAKTER